MKHFSFLATFLLLFSFGFGQNLIVNGDFESPGNPVDPVPAPWGGFKNRIVNDTIIGSLVGQVENGDGSLFQEFSVTPGDTFIVDFNYYWVNSGASNTTMTVRIKDANNLPTNLDLIGGTTANGYKLQTPIDQWFDGTFRFVPPAGIDSVRILFFKGNGNKALNLDSVSVILQVPCTAPTADFAVTDTNDLTLTFTDQSAGDGLSYAWDFGDGNTSTDASPTHTFAAAGTYTVCLSVTDSCGTTTTACDTILLVSCADIAAAFAVADTNDLALTFSNQSTGDDLTYRWTFGDGNASNEAEPTHLYVTAGTYEVCLQATDTCGAVETVCDSITVSSGPASSITDALPYDLQLYPNPAEAGAGFHLDLQLKSGATQSLTLRLTDMLGRVHWQSEQMAPQGQLSLRIPTQALPAGMYQVGIAIDGTWNTTTVVIR